MLEALSPFDKNTRQPLVRLVSAENNYRPVDTGRRRRPFGRAGVDR